MSIGKDFEIKMETEKICVLENIHLKGKNNRPLIVNLKLR